MKEKTIEQAIEFLREKNSGKKIKVKIKGKSMYPLIPEKSEVEIKIISPKELKTGDIAAYYSKGKFVIHRILGKKGKNFLVKGDNNNRFDKKINEKNIVGKAVKVNGEKTDSLAFELTKIPITVFSLITGKVFSKFFRKKMNIVITGTPGTGKTAIAKKLGKKLKFEVINEKDFALKTKTGKKKGKEVEIDTKEFRKKLNALLEKKTRTIIEGHVLCEMKIKADMVFLLRTKPEIIEKRLRKKGYNEVKIQDNVFCEETGYCREKCLKNYKKVIEIKNEKSLNSSLQEIIKKIKGKK
ncbi:MAG: signal peptidase I [archaeon]